MHQLLSDLEKERWSWIREGIDEFRKGFVRFVPTRLDKKEIWIGIYGPTQVGKTTLILKILGIKEEKIVELSDALRGKRTIANSATITATFYYKSFNHEFVIVSPNGDRKIVQTLNDFEKIMEEIRISIEKDNEYSLNPICIHFPDYYFDLAEIESRKQNIIILDLPGDESREEKEIKHVDRCLKKYLPQCRLCILMEISSQMVNMTHITREHVCDWAYLPEQFRVVLTRTLTSTSVREKINSGSINSTLSYENYFRSEMNRLLKGNRIVNRIYPLEIGNSWNDLRNKDLNFYNTVSPWINEMYLKLLEEIKSVESPDKEVKQLLSLENLAKKRKEEDLSDLHEKISKSIKMKEDIDISINSLNKKMEKSYSDFLEFEELIEEVKDLEHFTLPAVYPIANWYDRVSNRRNSKDLLDDFQDNLEQLAKYYNQSIEQKNRCFQLLSKKSDFTFIHISKLVITSNLSFDYLIKKYFLRKTFQKDLEYCQLELEKINKKVYKEVCSEIENKIKDIDNQIKKRMINIQNQKKENQKSINLLIDKSHSQLKEIKELKEKHKKLSKEWDYDIKRTQKLYKYLKLFFVKKASFFQNAIQSEKTKLEHKWAYHLYWNIIVKDMERICSDDQNGRTTV